MAARGAGAAGRAYAAHRRALARGRGRSGFQTRVAAFLQGLALLGWTISRNVRIDTRWATGDAAEIRRYAAELAALAPDVILATAAGPWGHCCRRPAPCRSCSRSRRRSGRRRPRRQPGAAGRQRHRVHDYTNTASSGKWLELLKQIAPRVTRVAVLRDRHPRLWNRPVRRHPDRGAVAQGGGDPDQHARRRARSSAPSRLSRAPRMAA